MKKTVTAAIKAAGQEVESREFNGETIYHFSPPGGEQTFSFAIAQGYLFMTNDTPTLEGTIRGRSGQGAPLSDSPDYKRSAKLFPAKTSMQTYQKSDVQMKMYYNLLKKMDSDAIEGIDVSKLPPFEAISKYLLPNAGYIVPDKKGFKTVSFTLKRND